MNHALDPSRPPGAYPVTFRASRRDDHSEGAIACPRCSSAFPIQISDPTDGRCWCPSCSAEIWAVPDYT
jgi:hypothetical protein